MVIVPPIASIQSKRLPKDHAGSSVEGTTVGPIAARTDVVGVVAEANSRSRLTIGGAVFMW
jgi:hypothetical protein